MISFDALERPSSPNTALYCDDALCPKATPDGPSVRVPVSKEKALEVFAAFAAEQPRLRCEAGAGSDHQHWTQRTKLLGFTDDITLRFAAEGPTATRIDLYTASRKGYYDFGVNEKRLTAWQDALRRRCGA